MARVERLKAESAATKLEAEILAENFDDSTGLSWLWAFLFGPIYFAVHGFWGRALLILVLNFVVIGFFVAPFLAYPAWRRRAKNRAERMLTLDKIRRGS
ncbi:MAG: DUF2628 domain-containing protein [Celeribacter sp.]